MITDEKKEEIRDASDIVEVVGDYVRLKRSGSGYAGLCPFHDEKTPSFHVTPSLNIYKCFGCGESGDVFSFVMRMDGVGFQEALRTLAERYGVSLPEENSPEEDARHMEREGIYHALRFAGLWFFRQLKESEEAETARQYLEKRGYDGKIIKTFGLGYAPADGEALLKAAKKEGIDEEFLLKADLVKPSRRNDGFYDTFRGRLMFPIFNPSGKVIAFAGRVLGKEKQAKYINSAQTPVYNKSEVVYGVSFAKNEIRRREEIILVEGYTDVITMSQYGVNNVVASSGTALTPQQIRILLRYGKRLVMIYDSDSAGQAAMKRGMNIALREGMEVDLLELPESEDPDSYVKKNGKEAFLELKRSEAADFVTFLIRQAENNGEMESPTDRMNVISSALETIAEIPNELNRQVYVQHLHQLTQKYRNSSDKELFSELSRILKEKKKANRRSARFSSGTSGSRPSGDPRPSGPPMDEESFAGMQEAGIEPQVPERAKKRPHYEMELIRLMLQYGEQMIVYIGSLCNEKLFEDGDLAAFYTDIITRYQGEEEVSVDHYIHREEPFGTLTGDIILERYSASERHHEKIGTQLKRDKDPIKSAKSTLKPLRLHYLKRQLQKLADEVKQASPEEKKRLVRAQANTQREISHIERTSAVELFPDPDQDKGDSPKPASTFDYKMREDRT